MTITEQMVRDYLRGPVGAFMATYGGRAWWWCWSICATKLPAYIGRRLMDDGLGTLRVE